MGARNDAESAKGVWLCFQNRVFKGKESLIIKNQSWLCTNQLRRGGHGGERHWNGWLTMPENKKKEREREREREREKKKEKKKKREREKRDIPP